MSNRCGKVYASSWAPVNQALGNGNATLQNFPRKVSGQIPFGAPAAIQDAIELGQGYATMSPNPGRILEHGRGLACRVDTLTVGVYDTHSMKSIDLIRELTELGWVLDRVRGSHHVFKHPMRPDILVVPHPKKNLGQGLIAAIRKQAGL